MKKRYLCLFVIITFFVIGCSLVSEEVNETEEKEAHYGQALLELTEDNSTDNPGLDQRYKYLQNQINDVLEGEQKLKMATFTRIKIELDYLTMKNYTPNKVNTITIDFMKAFSAAEKEAQGKDWGSSLSDRYYSLNKKIESFSTGETELTVVEYLQVENGIKKLEEDGYPVPNKVTELRSKLFQSVLAELESAIYDYEVPEIEEEIEEVVEEKEKVTEEVEKVEEEVITEIVPEEPTEPQIHRINLIDGGFYKKFIEIKVGDTIEWKNVRTGQYQIALVLGNNVCRDVKSKIFKSGESYNYTFNEPMTCWVSDGIFTTQAMKIIIS